MHTLCLSLVSLALLVVVSTAHSVTLRNTEEAKELAEKILVRATSGDTDSIVTLIKPYWPFPEHELEAQVAQTTRQRQELTNRLGKSIGYVLVRREALADTFLRLTYIEKLDKTGLRWVFMFYKGKTAWTLHSFSWDEDLGRLFSAASP